MVFARLEERPLHLLEQRVTISAAECLTGLRASLPALTNRLQEIAGVHAEALGIGIQQLQAQGFTWMLGRLSLRLHRRPAWREELRLTTWPNGLRGRLLAERQFVLEGASGERLLEASSEWLYVDCRAGRLARLPEAVVALSRPGTFAFGLCREKLPSVPPEAQRVEEKVFAVRRSEIDANLHVNNVHYTEWMLETLPEELFFHGCPKSLDIEYKQAAKLGDSIRATTYALGENRFLHTVDRATDGVLLARAVTGWAADEGGLNEEVEGSAAGAGQ